jgi:L-histidine Nalpha-methyltransferase
MIDQTFLDDVVAGLSSNPKTLPCKYLYDARGSELFDAICELQDYYPTRADLEATEDNIAAIVERVGPNARLVELGSGSSTKTRVLLDHLPDLTAYVPIDISPEPLARSAASLRQAYPQLEVQPVEGDYTKPLGLPDPSPATVKTVVYFPGSTIGNFHPPDAIAFMRRLRELVLPHGAVLIGVDLHKDSAVLERAYDDSEGVTAQFNLNLLHRMQRELAAKFDLDAFAHRARYDEDKRRIEMHLVSKDAQQIVIGGHRFDMAAGETIRSEVSYKYAVEDFARLSAEAGLTVDAVWTDRLSRFSLQYLSPR